MGVMGVIEKQEIDVSATRSTLRVRRTRSRDYRISRRVDVCVVLTTQRCDYNIVGPSDNIVGKLIIERAFTIVYMNIITDNQLCYCSTKCGN